MLLLSRPVRRDPPDKGRVRSPLLQPTELRLPAALRVPLEEPAPLLHDGDRGKNLLFPVFHGSCMFKPGQTLKTSYSGSESHLHPLPLNPRSGRGGNKFRR